MSDKLSFEKIFSSGKALIPFITAGYPTKDLFEKLVERIDQSGADIIEIGVPFSDPLADGVTIQRSSQIALEQGVNLNFVLSSISRLSLRVKSPIVIMTYYNPILSYGIENFVKDAEAAGVSGIIIPDLPFDEGEPLYSLCEEREIKTILMITPVTPLDRVIDIIRKASGFIYCVSLVGITGDSKKPIFQWVSQELPKIRKLSHFPIVLGFGIDSPETARKLSPYVDGIVVGSAFIKAIDNLMKCNIREEELLQESERFIRAFKSALKSYF